MVSIILYASLLLAQKPFSGGTNLVQNPSLLEPSLTAASPEGYSIEGDAQLTWVGYQDETPTRGISFNSYGEATRGALSQMVAGIDYTQGHWVKFSFRGRAEDGFAVGDDKLYMKIDFFSKNGSNYIDSAERLIYREVEKDRRDFTTNGDYGKGGAAVWRTYSFEELLPFKEVDSVKLTLAFQNGDSRQKSYSRFFATDFSLVQEESSSDGRVEPKALSSSDTRLASTEGLIPLGGRWFYKAAPGEVVDPKINPLVVTEDNAGRLFYRDDRLVNPFLGNMSAWLRKGFLDENRRLVTKDRFVKDNLTVTFDGSAYWTVRARNLPNHPTANFPDTYGTQGYNPNYIQEHNYVYRFPLDPQPNPSALAMNAHDANGALNMGAIGIAINGVAFYNPFDAGMQDASSIMDRCCGHPSPDNRYHYHKYPICVNTPFVDKGERHSPIVGFALDGLPIYGPYEEADVMARDDAKNPLNAFNAHYDPVRGWHYHVTPGKFPYLIGGYFGNTPRMALRDFGPPLGN